MRKIFLVAAFVIVGAIGAWLLYKQTGVEPQQPSPAKTTVEAPAPAAETAAPENNPTDSAQSQGAPAAPAPGAAQTPESPAAQAPPSAAESHEKAAAKKTKSKAKPADHKAKGPPAQ